MPEPKRRASLVTPKRHQRGSGSVGVAEQLTAGRKRLTPAVDLGEGASLNAEAHDVIELPETQSPATPGIVIEAGDASRVAVLGHRPTVGDPLADLFELPNVRVSKPRVPALLPQLLKPPLKPHKLYLPPSVLEAMKASVRSLRSPRVRVSQRTLLGFMLAYSYYHYGEWSHLAPRDARRVARGGVGFTDVGVQVVAGVSEETLALESAILDYLLGKNEEVAPSRAGLSATGVAWALSRRDEWAEQYVEWLEGL